MCIRDSHSSMEKENKLLKDQLTHFDTRLGKLRTRVDTNHAQCERKLQEGSEEHSALKSTVSEMTAKAGESKNKDFRDEISLLCGRLDATDAKVQTLSK